MGNLRITYWPVKPPMRKGEFDEIFIEKTPYLVIKFQTTYSCVFLVYAAYIYQTKK